MSVPWEALYRGKLLQGEGVKHFFLKQGKLPISQVTQLLWYSHYRKKVIFLSVTQQDCVGSGAKPGTRSFSISAPPLGSFYTQGNSSSSLRVLNGRAMVRRAEESSGGLRWMERIPVSMCNCSRWSCAISTWKEARLVLGQGAGMTGATSAVIKDKKKRCLVLRDLLLLLPVWQPWYTLCWLLWLTFVTHCYHICHGSPESQLKPAIL